MIDDFKDPWFSEEDYDDEPPQAIAVEPLYMLEAQVRVRACVRACASAAAPASSRGPARSGDRVESSPCH